MGSHHIRRLLVYVAAAAVVLLGGGWALLSARQADAGGSGGGGAGSFDLTLSTTADGQPGLGGDPGVPGDLSVRSTTTTRRIFVQVVGAVVRPGVYPLPAGSRVFDAIAAAGGVTAQGDEQALSLAALVGDGARVVVPTQGDVLGEGTSNGDGGGAGTVAGGGDAALVTPLSLSDATVDQLDALPGIGPSTAQRIVAYREEHGPFTGVEQLDDISGIGPATLARLEGLVVP